MKASLQIQTFLRNGSTALKQSYCTPPFKVADITEDKKEDTLHLMLMNASPGILDGDEYNITIEMEANTRMQLHTQSYQRLFRMQKGAKQTIAVQIQKGSSLVYLPHPAVPHEHSIFSAVNNIYIDDDCRLVWGEILTCGRKLNGEIFLLSKYHNRTAIFLRQKLVIKENLLIQPGLICPDTIGQLEGYTHQASFIYLDAKTDCTERSNAVYEYLVLQKGITFGVTVAPVNGLIIRLHGNKAEQLYECLKAISRLLAGEKKKTILHAG